MSLSYEESKKKQELVRQILLKDDEEFKKIFAECCHTKSLMIVIDVMMAATKVQDPKLYAKIETKLLGKKEEISEERPYPKRFKCNNCGLLFTRKSENQQCPSCSTDIWLEEIK